MCDCIEKAMRKIEEITKEKNKTYKNIANAYYCNATAEIRYFKTKKDGTPAKMITKETMGIVPSYCQICGKKIGG